MKISPDKVVNDDTGLRIEPFAKNLANYILQLAPQSEGVIHFLPFLINNTSVRNTIARFLPTEFVNLSYSSANLERRVRQYYTNPQLK